MQKWDNKLKKLAGCFEFLRVIIFNIYPFELVSFSWQRKGILLDNEENIITKIEHLHEGHVVMITRYGYFSEHLWAYTP